MILTEWFKQMDWNGMATKQDLGSPILFYLIKIKQKQNSASIQYTFKEFNLNLSASFVSLNVFYLDFKVPHYTKKIN